MLDLLEPVRETAPRPADAQALRYVRSYLFMRFCVGLLGIALPFALVLVDRCVFDGHPAPRDSLSAYYYSGVREVFVGTLAAIGVFLVTYKVTERNLDNTLSVVAGLAALLVAGFPTGRPTKDLPLTPLQDKLGECVVQAIHFGAAGTFIVSLGAISLWFGIREGRRERQGARGSPEFWRIFHFACAGMIAAALVWIVVTQYAGWPRISLLIGEGVSACAFGASWLAKGAELNVLLHATSARGPHRS
jgi:hypothetical protein